MLIEIQFGLFRRTLVPITQTLTARQLNDVCIRLFARYVSYAKCKYRKAVVQIEANIFREV